MPDLSLVKTTFDKPTFFHPNSTSEEDLIEFTTFTKELITLTLDLSNLAQTTTLKSYDKISGSYQNGELLTLIGITSGSSDAIGIATVTDGVIISIAVSVGGTSYTDTEKLAVIGQTSGASGAIGTATTSVNVITSVATDFGGGDYEETDSIEYPTDLDNNILKCNLDGGGNDMKITLTSGTLEGDTRTISAELRRKGRQ